MSKTLVKDVDFTYSYENNVEIGTGTVTANGIGHYVGSKSKDFQIVNSFDTGLCFKAEEAGSTVSLNNVVGNFKTSRDDVNWTNYTLGDVITLENAEDCVYFSAQGTNENIYSSATGKRFTMTGKIAAYGNIQSLLDDTCKSVSVPENCYNNIFFGCDSLTKAPELPATTLAESCYSSMFNGCTSLTQAPELPSTKLALYCYTRMFSGCTSLTQSPALPATSLKYYCYYNMFSGCSSLSQAPELTVTSLSTSCLASMFYNCKLISYIKTSQPSFTGCTGWLSGVASTGTFVCSKELYDKIVSGEIVRSTSTVPAGWNIIPSDCFCIEPNENPITVTLNANLLGDFECFMEWSGSEFRYWKSIEKGTAYSVPVGGKFYIRTTDENAGVCGNLNFTGSGLIIGGGTAKVSGHSNYLINKNGVLTVSPASYVLSLLFRGQPITDASALKLPTLLSYWACGNMFQDCTSLIKAPIFTATTLAERCYFKIFRCCTSLTQAPELPIADLATECYSSMFEECKYLTQAPSLPATTLASGCYWSMFAHCTSLAQAPSLPATTLANNCYKAMFYHCSSLIKAPELPATALVSNCYYYMFYNCSNLNYVKTNQSSFGDCTNWLYGVSSTGTFECPSTTIVVERGANTVPEGWNIDYKYDWLRFTAEQAGSTVRLNPVCTTGTYQISINGGECIDYTLGNTITLTNVGDYVEIFAKTENSSVSVNGLYSTQTCIQLGGKIAASGNVMSLFDKNCSRTDVPKFGLYGLFYGCGALTAAPKLTATSLGMNCYTDMFNGCSITHIKTAQPSFSGCYRWLYNVPSSGVFECSNQALYNDLISGTISRGTDTVPAGWEVVLA